MKLIRCRVEQFGTLVHYEREFSDGVNWICAPNGFGKTTLAVFCMAMFYGMPQSNKKTLSENDRRHYKPWQGGPYGGTLDFRYQEREYRIERFFGESKREDSFRLIDLTTGKERSDLADPIGETLFGLDAESFRRSVYLAEEGERVRCTDAIGGKLERDNAENADSGRVESAVELLEGLRKRYEAYRGGKGVIPALRAEEMRLAALEAERASAVRELIALNETETKRRERKKEWEQVQRESREQQSKEAEQKVRELIRERLGQMQQELDSLEEELQTLENRYPNGFPEPEECMTCAEQIIRYQSMMEWEEPEIPEEPFSPDASDEEEAPQLEVISGAEHFWGAMGIFLLFGAVALCLLSWQLGAIVGAVGLLGILVWKILWTKRKARWQQAWEAWEEEENEREEARQKRETAREQHEARNERRSELKEQIHAFCERFSIAEDGSEREQCIRMAEEHREWTRLSQEWEAMQTQVAEYRREHGAVISETEQTAEEVAELPEEAEIERQIRTLHEEELHAVQEREKQEARLQAAEEAGEQRKRCEARRKVLEQERDRIDQTIDLLQQAKDSFSSRYLETVRRNFSRYAEQCFGRSIGDFRIDTDFTLWISRAGESRGLEWFSRGSRELLALCLRFAVLDTLYRGERPFLLLDDPFVWLDEGNEARLKTVLEELGKRSQILCFRCRE